MSQTTVRKILNITLLVNAVVAAVVGLQHLLAPRLWTDLAGMKIQETVTWRALGAALIGYAVGSWIAYRETSWRVIRTVLLMQIVWSFSGAAVILWGIQVEGLPPLEWLNFVLLTTFAVAFSVLFALESNNPRT